MSEKLARVKESGSGGGTGDWTYAGTITKISTYVSGSLISGCYVVLPDTAKEVYIIVDPTKSGFTTTSWLMIAIIPILSFEDMGVIEFGSFDQSAFGVRINYQVNPVKNKKSIDLWNVKDRNGTVAADGGAAEAKVYYR